MLYNLGQLRQQIAQVTQAGINDISTGVSDFNTTTYPTSALVNQFINDSIREITSTNDFTWLETNTSIPFFHTISGVQGVELSGVTATGHPISGSIFPYPNDVLTFTWRAQNSVQDLSNNFSGLSFMGYSGTSLVSGTSVSGSIAYGNVNAVGYVYQLPPDISKIQAVVISNAVSGTNVGQGIVLQSMDWHDFETMIPIGIVNASGTPYQYSEFPGLGPNANKAIQFFPFPTPNYSGNTFNVHYIKKHVDMTEDAQTQNVIPEQFQYIVTYAVAGKIYDMLDNPKAVLMDQKKEGLLVDMKVWDGNSPDKIRRWRDYNYRTGSMGDSNRSAYDVSTNIWLP